MKDIVGLDFYSFIKQFSTMALENIFKEFPNKISHSFMQASDLARPSIMSPIFYGCYDWHSSVHTHWLLVRLLREPSDANDAIIDALNSQFTCTKAQGELNYLTNPTHKGFKRPYGWGWFLKLFIELHMLSKEARQDSINAKVATWIENLAPIVEFFAKAFKEFLPKMDSNTRKHTF